MTEPTPAGFHHVKIPVTDAARSRDWYQQVLGLATEVEFVEDGRLMGVAMKDERSQLRLAVRRDPDRATALEGFDPVAMAVETRADLEEWVRWLDAEGIAHARTARRPPVKTSEPRVRHQRMTHGLAGM
jgi:catechol 2,3-dioxygenase-like lactoylglutathione lyase family enzyme